MAIIANLFILNIQNIELMETITRSEKIRERLFECIHNREINNNDLLQIIEHLFAILNLQTLSDYAKNNTISYNGAKCQKNKIELGGVKFIIDNE